MTNSRRKGKDGELELVHALNEYGYKTRRGQQFSGANGDADVVGLNGIHIECKRSKRLSIYDAVKQAKSDAREGELPAVMHRKDYEKDWLVIMTLDDWVKLHSAWEGK